MGDEDQAEAPLTDAQRAAMKELERRLGVALKRYIARHGPKESVDDLYQTVLLETVRALGDVGDPDELAKMAHTIAARRCIDALRSPARRGHVPLDVVSAVSALLVSSRKRPELAAAAREQQRLVREAVASLDDRDRALLELYLEGVSATEIARRHGWADHSRASQRLGDIIKKLRKHVESPRRG